MLSSLGIHSCVEVCFFCSCDRGDGGDGLCWEGFGLSGIPGMHVLDSLNGERMLIAILL
jgi:hypothetical protein